MTRDRNTTATEGDETDHIRWLCYGILPMHVRDAQTGRLLLTCGVEFCMGAR